MYIYLSIYFIYLGSGRHPLPGAEPRGPGRDRRGQRAHRHGQVPVPGAKTARLRHRRCNNQAGHVQVSLRSESEMRKIYIFLSEFDIYACKSFKLKKII